MMMVQERQANLRQVDECFSNPGCRWRLGRLFLCLLLLFASAACVSRPNNVEEVVLQSRSFGFIDELLKDQAGSPQPVDAVLALPVPAAAPRSVPALVLLHTSNGQGSQDWLYAKRFRERGIAVLAVDSFSARDVSHTVRDQTLVSTASMLADAYAGLAYLSDDPRIDPERIGVMGFSKGGIAALYSAYVPVQKRASENGRAFALHIAYYPWCGMLLRKPVTTGAPVLIQSGALDDLVPPRRCAELIASSRGPEGPNRMELIVHPEARHGFDHPALSLFENLQITAPSPASCRLQEREGGGFLEAYSDRPINLGNLKEVLALCSRGGHAGGNEEAAARAFERTLTFLEKGGFLVGHQSSP